MNVKEAREWIRFALKDLRRAKNNAEFEDYELAVYMLQQCVEKSLKAVLILYGSTPPRTHNIRTLVLQIRNFVDFPENLEISSRLTPYAFTTRYPDEYVPVSKEEYEEAYKIAKKVYEWAKGIIEGSALE